MSTVTRVTLVQNVPTGAPMLNDFKVETAPAPVEASLNANELIIRPLYLSCDPYMRGRLTGSGDRYPIDGLGVGIGDVVTGGMFKWESKFSLWRQATQEASYVNLIGALGMPGFTGYVGLVTLCQPKKGETVLVSAASGAVGQIVVQLAKARGLRVVATAGSDDKVEYVKSLGADVAFNYKTCGSFAKAIRQAAPEGVDIFFDNVGGEFLDATLNCMKPFGRIAECGMISQYNATSETAYHIRNLSQMINKKLTMYGYIVSDYYAKPAYKDFISEVAGLENAPQALLDLFEGSNFGKRVIKVASRGQKL
ncbi:NAD(P)-binding protein [Linderina pennispora]|uniref:NAD(P)-binding protein n=1 Tax=Linderina pennispora TaxID=61395 RepID=A0A1Y1W4D4_9FUNG|nr:NAD(P)-binding protein [Linderina pennispora]ORX68381.1 NAD(P)-binding protein [Linderina pennispora]